MPELRWILALAGVGIVVFVYWYSRRRSGPGDRAEARVEPGFSDAPDLDALAESRSAAIDPRPADAEAVPPISLGEGAEPDAVEGLSARRDDAGADLPALEGVLAGAPAEDFPDPGDELEHADPVGSSGHAVSGSEDAAEEERVVAIRLKSGRPEGFDGAELLRAFAAGDLQFGRFDIFHRKAVSGTVVFSVASIVEPGSFDLEALQTAGCPGVTLFMVLPGPTEPVLALDDMLAVARRLAADLDGELLDERGVSLTVQREAHLREEIAEYARHHRLTASNGRPASV